MRKFVKVFSVVLFFSGIVFGKEALQISPTTFDFGWAPDNAKISAEFTLKNLTSDIVDLTAIQPTCGCTATNFTPSKLSSNDSKKIILTFNTRGYAKTMFSKSTKVKSDEDYEVVLKGHVTPSDAVIFPEGNGIVEFDLNSKKEQSVSIVNKSKNDATLEIVQEPAEWANVKLTSKTISDGKSVKFDISVSGDVNESKNTSFTVSAVEGTNVHYFTVAIRTGTPPPASRILNNAPKPTSAPAPDKKK
ncbi:MAG: DUF1573 domain-containing protein [Elusimicrobiota bacterium]